MVVNDVDFKLFFFYMVFPLYISIPSNSMFMNIYICYLFYGLLKQVKLCQLRDAVSLVVLIKGINRLAPA